MCQAVIWCIHVSNMWVLVHHARLYAVHYYEVHITTMLRIGIFAILEMSNVKVVVNERDKNERERDLYLRYAWFLLYEMTHKINHVKCDLLLIPGEVITTYQEEISWEKNKAQLTVIMHRMGVSEYNVTGKWCNRLVILFISYVLHHYTLYMSS